MVRPSASAKEITVELQPEEPTCVVMVDPERLQQTLWNLLSNAIKFTEAGGSVRVVIRRETAKVIIEVSDSGVGIEPEFLPFAFERFKQADASTTRRYGGLGLGLALVRHIVELHGGSVAAESGGLGAGSTFRVTLPVRAVSFDLRPDAHAAPPPTASAGEARDLLGGVRVLVVDDEADARDLLETVLTQAGATVESAASADGGIRAIARFRPHVVVSDIAMPGEDGYSFARRLQALSADEGGGIPTIALTAYTREEDRARAQAGGFTSHMGKPVSADELIAAVARLTPRS